MTVENEVLEAYADCGLMDEITNEQFPELLNGHLIEKEMTDNDREILQLIEEKHMKLRKLHFRASEPVNRTTAYKIMKRACEGYNNFDCEKLLLFPDDCKIWIAREGSVCLYIQKGEHLLPTRKQLHADEYDKLKEDCRRKCSEWKLRQEPVEETECFGGFKGEIRIWWD